MKAVHDNLRIWASEVEENTLQQAARTARLPIMAGPVALMPDAHLGIGATVGSVIATRNAIIPAAVGVDLGCGMIAVATDLVAADLPVNLGPFMDDVRRAVPAGLGAGTEQQSISRRRANGWLLSHPHPTGLGDLAEAAGRQLGSLGSGNHFFEVCLDERGAVWLVLHSGSRGVGNRLADRHIKVARALSAGRHLEDPDLAWLEQGSLEFQAYVADMLWSQEYARANRQIMADAATESFFDFVGKGFRKQVISCHHNFAQLEDHIVGDQLEAVWVTRKGAISARVGEMGVIPGSMGTRSYIVEGKGNPLAYHSSPHGAGRRMGRGEARRTLTVESLRERMAGKVWLDRSAAELLDEHPDAYKDIDVVMADSADLVTVVHELRQVLNYKGTSDRPRRVRDPQEAHSND